MRFAFASFMAFCVVIQATAQTPLPEFEKLWIVPARAASQASTNAPIDLTLRSGTKVTVPAQDIVEYATASLRAYLHEQRPTPMDRNLLFVLHIQEIAPVSKTDSAVRLFSGSVLRIPSSDIPVEPRLSALRTVLVQVIYASKPKPSPFAQGENTAKQATPDAFLATIRSMKSSITPIVCKYESAGETQPLLGTAVFLDEAGRFLTAAHVIDAANKACPNGTDVNVSDMGWRMSDRMLFYRRFEFQTARCIWDTAPDVDLAICATDLNLTDISRKVKVRPVQFDFTLQWDGTAVAYTGFHLGSSIPMTARGYIAMYTTIADALVLDQSTWLGASGGPVYLSDGRVIGLMVQPGTVRFGRSTFDSLFAGRAFARSATAIQAFLARAEAVEIKRAPPK